MEEGGYVMASYIINEMRRYQVHSTSFEKAIKKWNLAAVKAVGGASDT